MQAQALASANWRKEVEPLPAAAGKEFVVWALAAAGKQSVRGKQAHPALVAPHSL